MGSAYSPNVHLPSSSGRIIASKTPFSCRLVLALLIGCSLSRLSIRLTHSADATSYRQPSLLCQSFPSSLASHPGSARVTEMPGSRAWLSESISSWWSTRLAKDRCHSRTPPKPFLYTSEMSACPLPPLQPGDSISSSRSPFTHSSKHSNHKAHRIRVVRLLESFRQGLRLFPSP